MPPFPSRPRRPWLHWFLLLAAVAGASALTMTIARSVTVRLYRDQLVRGVVTEYALHPLPTDSATRWPVDTLLARLMAQDPYAAILTGGASEDAMALQAGDFGGIGIQLMPGADTAWIDRVVPDSPAAREGLHPGDQLLGIGHAPAIALSVDTLIAKIRGRPGTSVTLRLRRDTTVLERTLTRARVPLTAVSRAHLLAPTVGYVRVEQFAHGTGQAVADSVARLWDAGARSFILDLRGNGGGIMEDALAVAGLWVPAGRPLAHLARGVAGQQRPEPFVDFSSTPYEGTPLAILVDSLTASAAEILAGALVQEADAVLVGSDRTFGKGLVQEIFALPDGTLLQLTTATWLLPDLSSLHPLGPPIPVRGTGLRPTVWVPGPPTPALSPDSARTLVALAATPTRDTLALSPALAALRRRLEIDRAQDLPRRLRALREDPEVAAALTHLHRRMS